MKLALTILVVDDSEPMRAVLATILTSRGHGVVLADTVSAAKDALMAHRPDLILTDYNMPGGKGSELVRWVRAHAAFEHAPIFVVSSEQDPRLHLRMAQAGVDLWIGKPVCTGSLLSAVDAVAGQHYLLSPDKFEARARAV
jgi:two-component system, chemotaxis family, chemotaxis protein CheY